MNKKIKIGELYQNIYTESLVVVSKTTRGLDNTGEDELVHFVYIYAKLIDSVIGKQTWYGKDSFMMCFQQLS